MMDCKAMTTPMASNLKLLSDASSEMVDVTERNSYGLGYHNRQLDSINQSFPICKRNQISNTKGSYLIPYSGWLK